MRTFPVFGVPDISETPFKNDGVMYNMIRRYSGHRTIAGYNHPLPIITCILPYEFRSVAQIFQENWIMLDIENTIRLLKGLNEPVVIVEASTGESLWNNRAFENSFLLVDRAGAIRAMKEMVQTNEGIQAARNERRRL